MERDDQYYRNESYRRDDSNYRQHDSDGNAGNKLSNYQSRYQNRGNYYGMPDTNHEYENVRTTRGATFGSNSAGPMQRTSRNDADRYGESYSQRGSQRHNDSPWDEDQQRGSYRSQGNRSFGSSYGDQGTRSRDSHYHYGDPNPYMGGYEQTRGTGWERDSSGAYRGNYSTNDNSRYDRQDNSYETEGRGRRYSDFGRDEQRSYNPVGEDAHYDRSDFNYSSSDNDYGRRQHRDDRLYNSDSNHGDFQRGEMRDVTRQRDRDDNYATGLYASNRSYVSDHDDRDFSEGSSKVGRRHASGPNYDYYSPISAQTKSGSLR